MRNLNLRIWAIFLEKISIKVGASRTHIKNGQFKMQSLDTESLKEDPSDEYIEVLCRDPRIKEFMRLDSLLCKPVYIITGLKVASGQWLGKFTVEFVLEPSILSFSICSLGNSVGETCELCQLSRCSGCPSGLSKHVQVEHLYS